MAVERIAGPPEEPRNTMPRVTQPSDIGRVDIHGERAAMAKLHELERTLDRRADAGESRQGEMRFAVYAQDGCREFPSPPIPYCAGPRGIACPPRIPAR